MDTEIQKYLNTNIKDVINEYPTVQGALDHYKIGCAPCSQGTCMLKDVIEIHNLGEVEERELLTAVFAIIYPEQELVIPRVGSDKSQKQISFSPPVRMLMQEHKVIRKLLKLIPTIVENFKINDKEEREIILKAIDFIKNYADIYHHAKEEKILFTYFGEGLDIINVMLSDHISGRRFVQNVVDALESNQSEGVSVNLMAYAELLDDHIRKEDEILYPWMERNMSMAVVGEISSKFNEVEKRLGESGHSYVEFVNQLEHKYLITKTNY